MNKKLQRIFNHSAIDKRTVVITGATSGVGRAAAIEFAKYGAKLVLAARNLEALDEVAKDCREAGAIAISVKTDVTDPNAVKQLAATAVEFGGSIDVWINNAGVLAAGEFAETPVEIHDQVIKTNLLGYIHGAHAALPYFKRQQSGVLINNISVGGWYPVPYSVGYSASKFALRGFSEALRGELTNYPAIHICDLYPAFLDTPGIQHAANYTGSILKPAPPVYDPQRVARAMVLAAVRPKNKVVVGSIAHLLHLTHFLFPVLSRKITASVIGMYLKKAEPATFTSGNLFEPANFGTSIHGGWNSNADIENRKKKAIVTGAVAAIAIAGIVFGVKKLTASNKAGE